MAKNYILTIDTLSNTLSAVDCGSEIRFEYKSSGELPNDIEEGSMLIGYYGRTVQEFRLLFHVEQKKDENTLILKKTMDRADGISITALESELDDYSTLLDEPGSLIPISDDSADSLAKYLLGEKTLAKSSKIIPSAFIDDKTLIYLAALRTKPFMLLAGISGTGKSRIVRKLAQATDNIDVFADDNDRWRLHSPANFCIIQVKPNWHNSMDVVGFKSNIGKDGEHYEFTRFIEFVAEAWKYPGTPFFLCLDEMNLAPVEEYFAEFLSAVESRSKDDSGKYETDPIVDPFSKFGDTVADQMITHLLGDNATTDYPEIVDRFKKKGLTLPENLIVMGTVNMDETTFSFSRKVLDRAMSVEMNEVDFDNFISGSSETDIPHLKLYNSLLVDRPVSAQIVKDSIDSNTVINFLKQINELLEGTPFKLGYRAANEALLYVSAAKDFGEKSQLASLDQFTFMKILSRIEGDDSRLKTVDGNNLLTKFLENIEPMFISLSNGMSVPKLKQMIATLNRDKFVSFWS